MWGKEQRWKRKVELGRVGRKCIGHWVDGIEWERRNQLLNQTTNQDILEVRFSG